MDATVTELVNTYYGPFCALVYLAHSRKLNDVDTPEHKTDKGIEEGKQSGITGIKIFRSFIYLQDCKDTSYVW